jgi:hypothetical protein
MPKGNTMSRLLITSLAAAAIAAPAAVAQPTDPVAATKSPSVGNDLRTEATKSPSAGIDLRTEATKDMHASTVTKPKSATQDLRGEAAADSARAPAYPRALPGPPTWPTHPEPIRPAPAVVADGDDGGDGGIDLPVALLGIAGTLALGCGLTVAALRHRTRIAH